MALWFSNYTLENIHNMQKNMVTHLGIEFTEMGEDFLKATMPVDPRTQMPLGLLHGGASCVLAETMGSFASYLCIEPGKNQAVGLEINANHLRSVTNGQVTGICTPLHIGKRIHVWDIKIYDEQEKLLCVSRMTMAIVESVHS